MDFADAFQSLTQGMDEFNKKNSNKQRKSDKNLDNLAGNEVDLFRERNNISDVFIVKPSHNAKFSHKPIFSFAQLLYPPYNFSDDTLETISSLQYQVPMPVQAEIIPLFYKGHHMLVSAPTGSGKTAAYLLPILNSIASTGSNIIEEEKEQEIKKTKKNICHKLSPLCIILSTTQELLGQIWTEAVRLGQKLFPKNGKIVILRRKHYGLRKKSTPKNNSTEKKQKKCRELRLPKDTKIIITSPKRLATLIISTGKKCPINFENLQWLVIDECDKMLETNVGGSQDKTLKAFRSQLTAVLTGIRESLSPNAPFPTVSLFSATMPPQVVEWATEELTKECSKMRGLVKVQLGLSNTASSSVRQELRYCGSEQGKLLEIRNLLLSGLLYPCLIFTESRQRADELFKEILFSDQQILANILSGDKTEAQREGTIRAFREGKVNVLICTDLLGRGMDFKGLAMVVNYDLPPSPTEYIHRVGRTGRAGRRGHSITLWTDADLPHLGSILDVMKRSEKNVVDPELERLVAVWQAKKARQTHSKGLGGIILKRRGERKLVAKVAGIDRKKQGDVQIVGKQISSKKQKQLLRPWIPNRGKISDVPGSIVRDMKMGKKQEKEN